MITIWTKNHSLLQNDYRNNSSVEVTWIRIPSVRERHSNQLYPSFTWQQKQHDSHSQTNRRQSVSRVPGSHLISCIVFRSALCCSVLFGSVLRHDVVVRRVDFNSSLSLRFQMAFFPALMDNYNEINHKICQALQQLSWNTGCMAVGL